MEETCQECGTTISRRARANVWNGERIVCTPCLKKLQAAVQRQQVACQMAGKCGFPWLVYDGRGQHGPYSTEQLIQLLRGGRVEWEWTVWRDGMKAWKSAANLFTIPELC